MRGSVECRVPPEKSLAPVKKCRTPMEKSHARHCGVPGAAVSVPHPAPKEWRMGLAGVARGSLGAEARIFRRTGPA